MADSGVTKTVDNTGRLLSAFDALTRSDVLVGVPSDKSGRKQGPITNAALAYIHEFGSPARGIPPRPFLFPGVRNARQAIADRMNKGAKQALDGNLTAVEQTLKAVGMLVRNAVVRAITNPMPPFVPLKPATIRGRLRRTQAGRRKLRKFDKIKTAAGWTGKEAGQALALWAEAGDIQPLIDTGQLRASITYVVRPNVIPKGQATTSWGYQRDYGKMYTR